ncbi:PREDICTED: F-box/kelch-repeat protein At5g43190 [Lupinus angustifolius]|uniref:F-box/kelch-repeat protein At5g43190 n=1 Tax=Lupinus angustifolius TaxID=3871 RepID=UPI00092EB819|nr:PREDICTED: F-box/kelch-repeat protein At5g43190 [Lupinus angustifolius]
MNNKNKNIVLNKNITRSPQMDPIIWSKLPPEILEYILSFLPLKTFFNLRSTCKGFWSLIFSPSFITKHSSSTSPFSSFLLLSHPQFHRHFPLYDCTLAAWRNISLSLSDSLHYNSLSSPTFTTSLVSSGGLFCIKDSSSCSLLVCNILSKLSRKIEYPSFVFHIEHLTFVTTPNGYTIFVLCSQSQSSSSSSDSAFAYDSNMLSWTKFESFDPILSDNHHQQGVFYKGGLFFATPEPFSVVRFDLKSGKWERNIGELPNQVTFIRLVSDGKGKLYLIGGVGNNGISRSIKMWEMSEEWNWVEVEVLPEFMCKKFVSVCYHNYEHVYCFWHEGMICICCYTWPEILYYLVSRRTWHWLPRCPSLPMKCSCGFKWFSFVPKLYALV